MPNKNKSKEGTKKTVKRKKTTSSQGIKKVKITSSQKTVQKSKSGMTIGEMEEKKKTKTLTQNLVAILILVSGMLIGSLLVDVVQLATKNGYSERALRQASVFELGDKTWVAYDEPAIQVNVLVARDEDECIACDSDEILIWMKRFIPTMAIQKISEDSPEGIALIDKYGLKTIPSFVFSEAIKGSSFYQDGQVQEIFESKEDGLVLNSAALGIPAGKYLQVPDTKSGDITIGSDEAQVKITTFIDFQCPYSKLFYEAAKEARGEFTGDELTLVYKSFPLDVQGQAISAAVAARCSYEQGRFEEMADFLFANQNIWSETSDFTVFNQYALRIGLDMKEFAECTNSEESKKLVLEIIEQGDQFGIAGTPASFVEDEFSNGIFQSTDIVEIVESHLK